MSIPFHITIGHRIINLVKGLTYRILLILVILSINMWNTCGVKSMNVFKCLPVLSGVSSCAIFTILRDIQEIFKKQSNFVLMINWFFYLIYSYINFVAGWHYMGTIQWLLMLNLIGEFWSMKFSTHFTFSKYSALLCGQLMNIFTMLDASLLSRSYPWL